MKGLQRVTSDRMPASEPTTESARGQVLEGTSESRRCQSRDALTDYRFSRRSSSLSVYHSFRNRLKSLARIG